MALTHAYSVYNHGFAKYSTPSFSSISHSSRKDENSLKHTFSSPLAECYARDEISGQTSTFGHCNKDQSNGRVDRGLSSSWFNHRPRIKDTTKPGSQNATFHSKEQQSDHLRPELAASKSCYAIWKGEPPRPLLSPISFNPPANASEASDPIESRLDDEDLHKLLPSRAVIPAVTRGSNRCTFPKFDLDYVSAKGKIISKTEGTRRSDGTSTIKPGALSLGEGLRSRSSDVSPSPGGAKEVQPPKALHRTTGSRELRRSAGSVNIKRDCAPWVDQIIRATKYAGSCQSYGKSSLPRHARPRLWLDATKNEERVEEAHFTTVTHSPTKPKVITIARRGSSGSPIKEVRSCFDKNGRRTEIDPNTPPETPLSAVGLGINTGPSASHAGDGKAYGHARRSQAPFALTPPNSRLATPTARSTVRRTSDLSTEALRSGAILWVPSSINALEDTESWLISELETTVYNHPTARLYLDSPIIEHLRVLTKRDFNQSNPERSQLRGLTAPHSRYSTLQPLSSHPVTPQDIPYYQHIQTQEPKCDSDRQATSATAQSNATLAALRVVFPHAPGALLDSLQATYLALNYVALLPSPALSPVCTPATQSSPASSGLRFSSIPRKALATLGIQAPMLSPAESTSCLRSEIPDVERPSMRRDEHKVEQHRERIENLQVSLRISVRGLLGEIEGRRLSKRDESLVRAVGEVVRCGEAVASVSWQP